MKTILVVGAMKAGTSTLHYLLARHSRICAGREKELDFFRRDAPPAAYRKLFPNLDPERHLYRLDSSPNLSKRPRFGGVPRRLKRFPGKLRIYYVLRDPVHRLHSHVQHNLARGRWQPDAITDEHLEMCVEASCYAYQLDAFARAGLKVELLDFDELVAEPAGLVYRMQESLGLERETVEQSPRPRNVSPGKIEAAYSIEHFLPRLRRDTERLIEEYGFAPGAAWSHLHS